MPKEYEAKWDAQTLAEAEAIKADKLRMKKAKTAAKELSKEADEKAKAMKKIANNKRLGPATTAPVTSSTSRKVNVRKVTGGIKLSGTRNNG